MKEILSWSLQWISSVFEIWSCFQIVACLTDCTNNIKVWTRILRWMGIVIIGSLLAINRRIAFFSFGMFLIVAFFSILLMTCIVKKKVVFISSIIISYYTMIALQDFVFAFLSIIYAGSSFGQIIYFGNSIWKSVIYFISRILLIVLICVLLRKRNLLINVLQEYYRPFLAFGLFSLFVLRIYHTLIILIFNSRGQYVEYMAKEILASLIILLIVAYVTVLLLLKNSYTANQNKFLVFQERLLKEKYNEIAVEMENQQKVVHDIKHHFLVLRGLAREKSIEKIDSYLANIEEQFMDLKVNKWTKNEIVNLILTQKKGIAEKAGIAFQIVIDKRIEIPVTDSENCAIFGNLLDNAIEACGKYTLGKPWINVKIKQQGKMVMLEVENSTETFPQKVNGKWISSKEGTQIHGYGLKSVEDIVKRHNGIISYQTESDSFAVFITLFDS